MESTTLISSEQKLQQLKKIARVFTRDEQLETGMRKFQQLGLDPEDVDRMARLVDLDADDLYLAVSGSAIFVREEQPTPQLKSTVESEIDLRDRLRRLEETVSRIRGSAVKYDPFVDEDVVTQLRRIADHFDPPKLEIVGTSYIAERLGVTTKWVGDLVRKKEIPSSCICPKSGGGNYWRFWKKQIDKWIEER